MGPKRTELAFIITVVIVLASYLTTAAISSTGPASTSVITTIHVGGSPRYAAFDPADGYVYVCNVGSNTSLSGTIDVIDGASNTVVAKIAVGVFPKWLAFDSANGDIVVSNYDSHTISEVSGISWVATSTLSLPSNGPPVPAPDGVAFDPANGYLYVVENNLDSVVVINGANSSVVGAPIRVAKDPDGIAFNPFTGQIDVASDTALSVLNPANDSVEMFKTPTSSTSLPFTVAVDPSTGHVFVGNFGSRSVYVFGQSGELANVTLTQSPTAIAFDSATDAMFVAGSNVTFDINAQNFTLTGKPIPVGRSLTDVSNGVAFDSENHEIYVSNGLDGTISVIAPESSTPTLSFALIAVSIVFVTVAGVVAYRRAG